MAKKIKINNVIVSDGAYRYWDSDTNLITPSKVREALARADGDDIILEIASPGGLVAAGLEIYNLIIEYRKDNPDAIVSAKILGVVASMATIVALAAEEVEINISSVWMVHSPTLYAGGDYVTLQKYASLAKSFAGLLASIYAESGSRNGTKSKDEYQKMMDEETYLFGEEIIEAGFADRMRDDGTGVSKDDAVRTAREAVASANEDIKKNTTAVEDFEKLAAMMPSAAQAQKPVCNIQNSNIKKKEIEMSEETKRDKIENKESPERAYERGVGDGKKHFAEINAKVTKYMTSEYPQAVRDLGVKVLNGEVAVDALITAVTVLDAQKENTKSQQVNEEQGPDVSAEAMRKPASAGAVGTLETEADFQAEMKRMKGE
jgi:ATP-dependent protease ClpP protease subunit